MLRKILAAAPEYAKAYYNLGNALKEAHKAGPAIRAYKQALEHDPGHAEAHNNLGTVLEAHGQKAAARHEFSRAMALDGAYAQAHYNHALQHRFETGDPALTILMPVDYEKLVRGGADLAAQIAAHCGIRFDGDVTLREFQDDEIGGWKCYEKHLQHFRDRLVGKTT